MFRSFVPPLSLLVCTAALLSGCGAVANLFTDGSSATVNYPVGSEQRFTGTAVDFVDECVVDGYCYYVVETADGVANVIVHPGEAIRQCQNPAITSMNGFSVNVGDTVSVFGKMEESGFVNLCDDPAYTIQTVAQ